MVGSALEEILAMVQVGFTAREQVTEYLEVDFLARLLTRAADFLLENTPVLVDLS